LNKSEDDHGEETQGEEENREIEEARRSGAPEERRREEGEAAKICQAEAPGRQSEGR
jgi:hypothetical protein